MSDQLLHLNQYLRTLDGLESAWRSSCWAPSPAPSVALMFSAFSGHPTPTWELILGTFGGALLGLSASLGEVRRKKSPPDQPPPTPRGE